MFLNWLTYPQVQAFEHRYSEEGTVTKIFVTVPLYLVFQLQINR